MRREMTAREGTTLAAGDVVPGGPWQPLSLGTVVAPRARFRDARGRGPLAGNAGGRNDRRSYAPLLWRAGEDVPISTSPPRSSIDVAAAPTSLTLPVIAHRSGPGPNDPSPSLHPRSQSPSPTRGGYAKASRDHRMLFFVRSKNGAKTERSATRPLSTMGP